MTTGTQNQWLCNPQVIFEFLHECFVIKKKNLNDCRLKIEINIEDDSQVKLMNSYRSGNILNIFSILGFFVDNGRYNSTTQMTNVHWKCTSGCRTLFRMWCLCVYVWNFNSFFVGVATWQAVHRFASGNNKYIFCVSTPEQDNINANAAINLIGWMCEVWILQL